MINSLMEEIWQRYDLSINGFLPNHPIGVLNYHFKEWEEIMYDLPNLVKNKSLRNAILACPNFEHSKLETNEQYKRGYVILSMLSNAYLFSDTSIDLLPSKLAVPLVITANKLGINPVLTHATVDLYNWCLIDAKQPISLENLKSQNLITGTMDESWFYLIMIMIEKIGGHVIMCILDLKNSDESKITQLLLSILLDLKEICSVIKRMNEKCSPEIFYHKLRPYLSGSKNNDSLPNGIIYEGVSREPFKFYGGSAAESSLFQVIDAAFGIHHSCDYFVEIRDYMPKKHKDFINYVEKNINVRTLIDDDPKLLEIYQSCVNTITTFRNLHYGLIHQYIIKMSSSQEDNLKGSGGTELSKFLKTSIRETSDALS